MRPGSLVEVDAGCLQGTRSSTVLNWSIAVPHGRPAEMHAGKMQTELVRAMWKVKQTSRDSGAFDVGKRGGRLGIEVCVGVRDARIGDHLAST